MRRCLGRRLDYFASFAAEEANLKTIFKSSAGVRTLECQVIQAYRALDRWRDSDVGAAVMASHAVS